MVQSTELDSLRTIVIGCRRQHLADVKLEVQLPEYSQEACERVESEEDQRINSEAFSRAVSELFAILKA
jgi:hypothetical protein